MIKQIGEQVKSKRLIIGAITVNIIAIFMNFPEFLMGHPVTIENKIVTGLFMMTWIVLIGLAMRAKDALFTKFSTIYWGVAFLVGLATYITCIVDIDTTALLLPVILFVTPTYGLIGMANPYIPTSTIIFTMTSLAMLIIGAYAWIKTSANNDRITEKKQ